MSMVFAAGFKSAMEAVQAPASRLTQQATATAVKADVVAKQLKKESFFEYLAKEGPKFHVHAGIFTI